MKLIFALFVATFLGIQVYAQDSVSVRNNLTLPVIDSTAEKLVQMALENPRIKSIENLTMQNSYEYKRSKSAWLNNIVVAGNLNELSIKKQDNTTVDPLRQSTQYPRYNIGASIPLGLFINNGKQTKANFYRYESFRNQIDVEKQNIRSEVLLNYETYIYNKQLLALQQEVVQDAKMLMRKQEEKFSNGQLSLEDYTNSMKAYNNENVKELGITHALRAAEIALEELIGMNLQEALSKIANAAAK